MIRYNIMLPNGLREKHLLETLIKVAINLHANGLNGIRYIRGGHGTCQCTPGPCAGISNLHSRGQQRQYVVKVHVSVLQVHVPAPLTFTEGPATSVRIFQK